ncbi:SHD1 domain-containing protein [Novipirellula herctigrandis]
MAIHSIAEAQTLRYTPNVPSEVEYEFDINLDLGPSQTSLKGTTRYKIESLSDGEVRMTFQGGLSESTKNKSLTRRRTFPPRHSFSHSSGFGRTPTYRGLSTTSNTVTITSLGELVALQGESQLPYLLGHLSLLPFEPLPPSDQTTWKREGTVGVAATESQDRFGFPPFSDRNDRDLRTASTQMTYELLNQNADQASIKKTYKLIMPLKDTDSVIELDGSGTWVFDKKRNLPGSMDFTYQLKVELGGAMVTAPLRLRYHLLTEAEVAKRKAAADERKAKAEREAAERAEIAARPVTAIEKTAWLKAMRTGNVSERIDALRKLTAKTPADPDREIVATIRKLTQSDSGVVVTFAKKALEKWDREFASTNKLVKSYDSHMHVESTGRTVTGATPLYSGQIVQVNERSNWWKAATVKEVLPSGRVEIEFRGPFPKRAIVEREKIQLAPKDLPQPASLKSAVARSATPTDSETGKALTPFRVWTDATSKFKVRAKLLLIANDSLVLSREDGNLVTVPLSKMSEKDQAFIEGMQNSR